MISRMRHVSQWIERNARWLAVCLLLLFFWRLWHTANVKSVTFDEVLHILHGVLYWQHGSLYSVVQNPPLVNAVMGAPVSLVFQPALPFDLPVWGTLNWLEISKGFMWEANDNGRQLLAVGRLAVIWLAVIFGALIYRWSGQLFRARSAGLFALFLFTFDPNVLAHGHLATTDMGFAFFLVLAAYLIWRYWQRPFAAPISWPTYLLAGVGVGLAFAAKFSGILLVPALILIALYRLFTTGWSWKGLLRTFLEVTGWLLIGAIVFLAIYRFQFEPLYTDYLWQRDHQLGGHSSFLFGALTTEGWWYYFPVVWAIKTPLAVLFLALLSITLIFVKRQFGWELWWPLLLVGAIFAGGLTSRVNIGYRYLLPMLPLLYVVIGQLARPGYLAGRVLPTVVATAVAATALGSILIHPDYLAYFNQLAGGPDNGWRIVVDSNIDWGQDIQPLADYMEAEGIESVYISFLGTASLAAYGVQGQQLPAWPVARENKLTDYFYPDYPAPGVYVISATQLQGVYLQDKTRFRWFLEREPDDKVGYSLFVYEVKPDGPPINVALSGIGIGHIDLADFQRAFGSNDVRASWYDARTSVLWPGGRAKGAPAAVWSAVGDGHFPQHLALQAIYPAEGPRFRGADVDPSGTTLEYSLFVWPYSLQEWLEQREPDHGTLYREFFWTSETAVSSLQWTEKRQPLSEAAVFDDTFELLAYETLWTEDTPHPGQPLELMSYWRVNDKPTGSAKIFLHLVDAEGNVVVQHDGLDVRVDGLQPGDEFAQLHTIWTTELEPGSYAWQIGMYDPDNPHERLLINTTEGSLDRLLLHAQSLSE